MQTDDCTTWIELVNTSNTTMEKTSWLFRAHKTSTLISISLFCTFKQQNSIYKFWICTKPVSPKPIAAISLSSGNKVSLIPIQWHSLALLFRFIYKKNCSFKNQDETPINQIWNTTNNNLWNIDTNIVTRHQHFDTDNNFKNESNWM